ncbi:hypothetical protein [Pseudonocardia sp. TRM90224]|uniref:hypothetical protein n=1 Tax=Pseudonocardia sp. TRM90224 TaxID=2812678 RepID=UPI001E3ACB88|nr:hypothetical protein [Pseudonocardia sp. TRM90224]
MCGDLAKMGLSWSIFAMPLHHALAMDGGRDWIGSGRVFGRLDLAPGPSDLPTAADVVSALRRSGGHGTPWFDIEGIDQSSILPSCQMPAECDAIGGHDLGEISLHRADERDTGPLAPDVRIGCVSFRKPAGAAVLSAVVELVSVAGPTLAFCDSDLDFVVVSMEDTVDAVAGRWPW